MYGVNGKRWMLERNVTGHTYAGLKHAGLKHAGCKQTYVWDPIAGGVAKYQLKTEHRASPGRGARVV
jgi:hypothetical protein